MKIKILALLFCSLTLVHSIAVLSIAPDTTFAELGQIITIDVTVNQVNDLYSIAFDLIYDPFLLNLNSIEEGTFLDENGTASTSFIYDNSQYGRIIVALARLGSVQGVSTIEDTTLVSVHFTTMNLGMTILSFENVGLMDSTLDPIAYTTEIGTVTVTEDVNINNIELPEQNNMLGVTIYPNPVRNYINLMIKNSTSKTVFKLYNIKGQLIEKRNLRFAGARENIFYYNSSKLSCGYYILSIENEKQRINKKIIKIN